VTAALTRLDGPAPEVQVARDMVKRAAWIAPVLLVVCGALWGVNGVLSSAYGVAIVVVNLVLSALLLAGTARISLALMMAAALFGYLVRLGLIFLAVLLVRDASWTSLPALGTTLIVTHLGLLFWEIRYVSASLAFPGLKPPRVGLVENRTETP
jgi:hypothetical protein